MANETQEKQVKTSKSFMTAGPTLHYSHANVHGCYLLTLAVYLMASLFWSKLMTGDAFSVSFTGRWYLGPLTLSPLSIFEYPAQIFVIGILVGILVAVPVLTSQLMSFRYSILLVLILTCIAKLPGLGLFTLISCIAVASRPLRFRSRYISIVSCMSPILLYLGFFCRPSNIESVRWALSFSPWLDGVLTAMFIAAVVLAIGHFTRYRPGLIWSINTIMLLVAIILFQGKINLAELDYQLYIAKNNPEAICQFQPHSITEAIDQVVKDPISRNYFQPPFYPTETIPLRATLKREIQHRLTQGRWPEWFEIPDELRYQDKKQELLVKYELFINPQKQWWKLAFIHNALLKSKVRLKRMPVALYYKALLSELSPDISILNEKELLQFYSDYPNKENLSIWHRLYFDYPGSTESIEARWRRAVHLVGIESFLLAEALIDEALHIIKKHESQNIQKLSETEKIFSKPAETVITDFELRKIKRKFLYLRELISEENHGKDKQQSHCLSEFVLLNKHDKYYLEHLNILLEKCGRESPISDNIILAKIMLIPDAILRAEKLGELAKTDKGTDGGIRAKFEQACLKVKIWKEHNLSQPEKDRYLAEARRELEEFIKTYPDSLLAEEAKEKLNSLPAR